jgi:hypothetical protein
MVSYRTSFAQILHPDQVIDTGCGFFEVRTGQTKLIFDFSRVGIFIEKVSKVANGLVPTSEAVGRLSQS